MRCLSPIWMYDTGKLTANGKRLLTAKPNPRLPFDSAIPVPCGKCEACLAKRRNEWVSRLRLEGFSSSASSFVTLTYADNPRILDKRDIQLFIKRLRQLPRDSKVPPFKLRYFVAGEYGKLHNRPHWHGILFGIDFLNPIFSPRIVCFKESHPIYSSDLLSDIWKFGYVTVDSVSSHSIKYVAKYCTKADSVILKSQGLGRSFFVNVSRTGRSNSYSLLGRYRDFALRGFLHLPDRFGLSAVGIPKAFDRYLERCDPSLFDSVKSSRRSFVSNLPFDSRSAGECLRSLESINKNTKERLLDEHS